MKQNTLLLLLATLLLSISSCKKECNKKTSLDYLVFGHFYGECLGENCIEIFKLEPNLLQEDTLDNYPESTNFYNASYVSLSAQKYSDTKDLVLSFPADLWSETDTVIGMPDAGDWGGIYIEASQNGKKRFWLLDQAKGNVPAKYHNFIDQVNAKILMLK